MWKTKFEKLERKIKNATETLPDSDDEPRVEVLPASLALDQLNRRGQQSITALGEDQLVPELEHYLQIFFVNRLTQDFLEKFRFWSETFC